MDDAGDQQLRIDLGLPGAMGVSVTAPQQKALPPSFVSQIPEALYHFITIGKD